MKKKIGYIILAAFLLSFFFPSSESKADSASASSPDMIFLNGNIITMDAKDTKANAVAVKDEKFIAIGTNEQISALAGAGTKRIDLAGRTVFPGFVDGHAHPMEAMYLKTEFVDGRYPGVASVRQLLGRIRDKAATTPKGEWIQVVCVPSSHNKFKEKRMPTMAELDAIAPNNPVVVSNGAHLGVLNRQGLERMGFSGKTTKLKTGSTALVDKKGQLTGVVADPGLVSSPTPAAIAEYFATGIPKLWNEYGFTSVMAITPSVAVPIIQEIALKQQKSDIRYTVSVWKTFDAGTIPDDVRPYEMPDGSNPAYFKFAALKSWVDGENDCRTGLMYEKYAGHQAIDPPGERGTQTSSFQHIERLVKVADKYRKIGMLHCSGDKAVDIGLDAYEKLVKSGDSGSLKRIEHFGVFQIRDEQLKRAQALIPHGFKISVQPEWLMDRFKANEENMGVALADSGLKMRTLIDVGLEPAAGTDVNGITFLNMNPFRAIYATVTRKTDAGLVAPKEAITVKEAMSLWTVWPAKAAGEEKVKGTIEVGKFADMTVLSDNPFSIPKDDLLKVKAVMTIVGGRIVYKSI